MTDQLNLNQNEKEEIKKVIDLLLECQDELSDDIKKTYLSFAFENRFTLHPRRLGDLASSEVKTLKTYFSNLDSEPVIELGREHALDGLGEKSLLSFREIIHKCLSDKIDTLQNETLMAAQKVTDAFINNLIFGYIRAREEQTLEEQEQLRKALSSALDRQRRELFIKDHAIHTYINGIMLTDLDGNVTYVNPAFVKMWGYDSNEEILNLNGSQFLSNTDFNLIMDTLMDRGGWQSEFRANRRDDSSFDLVISASLIRDDTDQTIGIMISFIDVTEKKRLETQFRQAQKMDALGQLAGGIIHDFNNLLQVISGYTQLELMNLAKGSDRHNNLMQIKIAADRGKGLTEQLRFFTRQDKGKKQPLYLNDVINETYNLLKRTFEPEISIKFMLDSNLRTIKADPSQMSQLLMNLCVNARQAMMTKKTGKTADSNYDASENILTLETSNYNLDKKRASLYLNAQPGQYVCVRISDTGRGMPPESIERLFEPFYTTKSEKSGIGLGLSVVYGIVTNLNGFIDVRSKEGEGSTFEIYLPAPALGDEVNNSVSKHEDSVLTYGKGAILVVDDESQVRDLAVQTLKKCGYDVLIAENGVEALSVYEANRDEINLVVLDLIMPQMGGWECYHNLKEINPNVKVLIMTGYTTIGSEQDFLKKGVEGIIIKPFELDTFTDTVQKTLSV